MSLDKENSEINLVIKKRIRLSSAGIIATEQAPTDIVAVDGKLYLYRKGEPLEGQTPLDVKTIGGQSIFGAGDIPSLGLEVVSSLPKEDEASENALYAVLSEDGKNYLLYFWSENEWHAAGATSLDAKIATEDAIGGIRSSKVETSEDGERNYVRVEENGLAYVKAAKLTDSPTAKQDIVNVLNGESDESSVILFGGDSNGL